MQAFEIKNPINATQALVTRETYGFVNTRNVLDAFAGAGWVPVSTSSVSVRKPEREGFQKHLVRLENPDFKMIKGLTSDNLSRPQLVLLNSHDGDSTMQLLWGLIRIACLNGIIAGDAIQGVRLVHSKSVVARLPSAIEHMISNLPKFADQIERLQGSTLSAEATSRLIKVCFDARLEGQKATQVSYTLPTLRAEDRGNDAFTVYNKIQERIIRGGINYTGERTIKNDAGEVISKQLVRATTRAIGSVSGQVKYNQLAYSAVLEAVG